MFILLKSNVATFIFEKALVFEFNGEGLPSMISMKGKNYGFIAAKNLIFYSGKTETCVKNFRKILDKITRVIIFTYMAVFNWCSYSLILLSR